MAKLTAHVFEEKWRSDDVKLQEASNFDALLVSPRVLSGLKKAGFKTPSPIQMEAVPIGRFGSDLVVQAKSGTGKTLVFTIVALDIISVELKAPQVLILAPTREIAFQICDVIKAVGCTTDGLKCCTFIGGIPVETDFINVQGCHIVVGTPGRINQLLDSKILKAPSIRLLVLDEADQLLDPSFKSAMDAIFKALPEYKQIIATSATYPKSLAKLVNTYFKRNPTFARLNESDLALLGIMHYTCYVENTQMPVLAYKRKLKALETILTSVKFAQCLVFCNQVSRVETLCNDIKKFGFSVTYISSAKEQAARLKAIDSLKRFKCKILVSSDITSRGIDAENVDLIINVDLPYTPEVYLHRVGRAGRFGSRGVAITFVSGTEKSSFEKIQKEANFICYRLPDPVPENLLNMRPTEFVKENSIDRKCCFTENFNDSIVLQKVSTVSNGIGDTSSKNNSEDFSLNENNFSEDSAISASSEDSSVKHSTSSEDTPVNQGTSSENTSVIQGTSSENTSLNRGTSSDASFNRTLHSVASLSALVMFPTVSLADLQSSVDNDQIIESDVPACNSKDSASVDEVDINIVVNKCDYKKPDVCSKVSKQKKSTSTAALNSVASFNQTIHSEASLSVLLPSVSLGDRQSSVDNDGKGIGNALSKNKIQDEKNPDEIKVLVRNYLNEYKKMKAAVSVNPLIHIEDKSLCSSKKINPPKRNGLMDFYFEVFDLYNNSIGTCDVEQLDQIMADIKESTVENLDGKCVASGIENGEMSIADHFDLNLCTQMLEYATYTESNCPSDSVGDSSAKDVVSTPNAKASRSNNNQLVVSSNTPPFPSSFVQEGIEFDSNASSDSETTSFSETDSFSGTEEDKFLLLEREFQKMMISNKPQIHAEQTDQLRKALHEIHSKEAKSGKGSDDDSSEDIQIATVGGHSSRKSHCGGNKCLQQENACKSKIGTVSKTRVSKNSKRDVQEGIEMDSDCCSDSETTSSLDADAHNIKRGAVSRKQVSMHLGNLKNAKSIISSGTVSETASSSHTDSLPSTEEPHELSLLERGFQKMMRSNNKPHTCAEQTDQPRKALHDIHSKKAKSGKGSDDDDSLADIQIAPVGGHSSRKSHCGGNKSSMKSESNKIFRNSGRSSGSDNKLKGQQSKYQSDKKELVSDSSESSYSGKEKVSKSTKEKTPQRVKGLPTRLNRNEDSRVAESNDLYFSNPHTSRHAGGSHFNHQDHFQNAVYPNSGHNVNMRPSQYPCYHSSSNHHGNCPNVAFAEQNLSSQPSRCRHSHCQGYLQNTACSNQGHSRSTQHCHGMNGSLLNESLNESLNDMDMYYRQWYWINQGAFFQ